MEPVEPDEPDEGGDEARAKREDGGRSGEHECATECSTGLNEGGNWDISLGVWWVGESERVGIRGVDDEGDDGHAAGGLRRRFVHAQPASSMTMSGLCSTPVPGEEGEVEAV